MGIVGDVHFWHFSDMACAMSVHRGKADMILKRQHFRL
jgi:hypothetical protein